MGSQEPLIVCAWWYRGLLPWFPVLPCTPDRKAVTGMASKQEAIEFAQREVELWSQNTAPVYFTVRELHEAGASDVEIAGYMVGLIREGEHESESLMFSGEGEAAFGDADGITFDDIDWTTVIDDITDRNED